MLADVHAASGLMLVIYTGDGWTTATAWGYVGSHIPSLNYVTATGLDWMLFQPNVFIIDLPTRQVIAKDQEEENMTPAEILAVVQGNDS